MFTFGKDFLDGDIVSADHEDFAQVATGSLLGRSVVNLREEFLHAGGVGFSSFSSKTSGLLLAVDLDLDLVLVVPWS